MDQGDRGGERLEEEAAARSGSVLLGEAGEKESLSTPVPGSFSRDLAAKATQQFWGSSSPSGSGMTLRLPSRASLTLQTFINPQIVPQSSGSPAAAVVTPRLGVTSSHLLGDLSREAERLVREHTGRPSRRNGLCAPASGCNLLRTVEEYFTSCRADEDYLCLKSPEYTVDST